MRKETLWESKLITGYIPTLLAQKLRYVMVRASETKARKMPDEGNGFLQCILTLRKAIDTEMEESGFDLPCVDGKAPKKGKANTKALDSAKAALAAESAKVVELEAKLAETVDLQTRVDEQEEELTELDAKIEKLEAELQERDNALANLNKAAKPKKEKGGK